MKFIKISHLILIVCVTAGIIFVTSPFLWAHGDSTQIIPDSLTAKAGSNLKVMVKGLVGAKTAKFNLTGISGRFELDEFSITSDDFTQVLQIPAEVPTGSYRLTVKGGKKSAKVVIHLN